MGKGKRLRGAKKNKIVQDHFREMQRRESIRRAFAMTPIAIAVKNLCRNWGKT